MKKKDFKQILRADKSVSRSSARSTLSIEHGLNAYALVSRDVTLSVYRER